MSPDDFWGLVQPWVEQHHRPAWKPQLAEGDGLVSTSKFGGSAFIPDGEAWPVCGECGRSMVLLVQLNLDEIPQEVRGRFGSGILQVFGCFDLEADPGCGEESGNPFESRTRLVRSINLAEPGAASRALREGSVRQRISADEAIPVDADRIPAKRIVGWRRFRDLPCLEEGTQHGLIREWNRPSPGWHLLRYGDGCLEVHHRDVGGRAWKVDRSLSAHVATKLGGWPAWIQAPEYPDCPRCRQPMRFVFQVETDELVGDDPVSGYITQCAEHQDVVGFTWQCT